VIAPPSVDAEIGGRITFAPKAETPNQPQRRAIAGLDVGFEPMQTKPVKCVLDDE